MRPKDKYTMFDRKEKKYRKGIHSKSDTDAICQGGGNLLRRTWWADQLRITELPKWTRVSQRVNPPGY